MKKNYIIILVVLLILTGCEQSPQIQKEETAKGKEIIQNTNTEFKTEVPQIPSPITGVSLANDAYINTSDMEQGLMEISKNYVDTQNNIYSPGSVLTVEDANNLLNRVSKETPDGLNPAESSNPKESPIYVNTLIEQDYFSYDENNEKKINTIAIGAGIDPSYKYDEQKDPYEISDEEISEFITEYLANKIAEYIHQKDGYKNVNIVFGLFKESQDGLVPGNYYTYGFIPANKEKLEKVEYTNTAYQILPGEAAEYENSNKLITDLENSVDSYFQEYSGLTAIAKIQNKAVVELGITININIYSVVDANTFTEYIINKLKTENIQEIPKVEISIKSSSNKNIAIIVYENGKLATKYVYQNNF